MAVNGEKFWARNQRRYKQHVVIPDVVISEVYCNIITLTVIVILHKYHTDELCQKNVSVMKKLCILVVE